MLLIKNLKKSYGRKMALDGLDLEINTGEIFGFVGPNGAGKTTTMKILAGLLKADQGEIFLDGIQPGINKEEFRGKIGYMPDFFGVYDNLKVIEYMEFFASLYGITGQEAKRRSIELIEQVNLKEQTESYVDSMSRGMKQRLCLARSMIHDPALLILDEPAAGLDPGARSEMKEIIRRFKESGKTILISSHILPELESLCTCFGIMRQGRIVMSGTLEEIKKKLKSKSPLVIRIGCGQDTALKLLKESLYVESISIRSDCLYASFSGGEEKAAQLLRTLVLNGVEVISYYREEGSLESLFMQITGKEGRYGSNEA